MKSEEAINKINSQISQIDTLVRDKRFSSQFKKWQRDTEIAIEKIFGSNTRHIKDFKRIHYSSGIMYSGMPDSEYQQEYIKGLEDAKAILLSIVQEIKEYGENDEHSIMSYNDNFWSLIHPKIVEISKSRYDTKHFADSVEAALKEINIIIKKVVKKKTGKEYDGADLMNRAFSLQEPLIVLSDLSTEDGKNIQKGYMQIFSGAMTGIRNPKAHDNVQIDDKRAVHLLFLASLLMYKIDEQIN